jgi:hypothetical protein
MVMFYFPDKPEFKSITCCSPLDNIICNRKPFGEVSAEDYFEYAKTDLGRGERSGLIDAFSNAKRCFHYQVDRLLYRYALRDATREFNFPSKVSLLSELNVLPSTLLRIYNRERNAMEHEYAAPSQDTVSASVELCDLMFLASQRFLCNTPGRLRIKFKNDERDLIALLEPGENKIQFFEVTGSKFEEHPRGKYYWGAIFDFENNPLQNITIKRIETDDICLDISNKDKWIIILKLFSSIARDPEESLRLPEEPMATMHHSVPWRVLKEAFTQRLEFMKEAYGEG